MKRDIHDIYDVILKIIAMSYGTTFLNYINVGKKINEVLNSEITTMKGNKIYLDFLCSVDDDTLCHIEFQFPMAKANDLDRFFNYNITAQVRHQKLTETTVINFTSNVNEGNIFKIGETKCFKPKYFHLGDIDFEDFLEKINIKVNSNTKLTSFEEITLMLICLIPKCENKGETLKRICEILKKKELFDESKLEFVEAVIKLEIENLLTFNEQKNIEGEIKMTPQAEKIILQAIHEVNKKTLYEAKTEGKKEGIQEGIQKGIQKIAQNLKGNLTPEEISKYTGLTIKEIEKL